jgi:hypothetical protein
MAAPPTNALVRISGEQLAVRLDADGFLTRVERTVRLHLGTELYCAAKAPTNDDKVQPYQPGYMALVSAMGGELACPPVMRDPVTGDARPNPLVEVHPGTGIIRRVSATAVCVVPDPSTGALHASVQTIVVDAEHVLRQALLKMDRADDVVLLSEEDIAADKAAGKLRGWAPIPLAPPHVYIVANLASAKVREAFQTFQNQSATMRQRACSKAERLAADHNPVTRRTWRFGNLNFPAVTKEKDGTMTTAAPYVPYIDVAVVAWVTRRGKGEMDGILRALSTLGQHDGVSSVIVSSEDDVIDVQADVDAEVEDGTPDAPRIAAAPLAAQDAAYIAAAKEAGARVNVGEWRDRAAPLGNNPGAQESKPTRGRPPSAGDLAQNPGPGQQAPELVPRSSDLTPLRSQIKEMEAELREGAIESARIAAGLGKAQDLATVNNAAVLRDYRSKLSAALDGES